MIDDSPAMQTAGRSSPTFNDAIAKVTKVHLKGSNSYADSQELSNTLWAVASQRQASPALIWLLGLAVRP
eukprot:7023052-Karenia_brevis.AAC.1